MGRIPDTFPYYTYIIWISCRKCKTAASLLSICKKTAADRLSAKQKSVPYGTRTFILGSFAHGLIGEHGAEHLQHTGGTHAGLALAHPQSLPL